MQKENPSISQHLASWKDRLTGVSNELDALGRDTEHAFLTVGDRLGDFYDRAREISRHSSSVAASLSGSQITTAIDGLQALLARSSTLLTRNMEEFDEDVRALNGIVQTISRIDKPIAGFRKIVKNLSVLSVSTKIESAQLHEDGHDFLTIAEDVERLSVLINSSFADILGRAESVNASVEEALSGILGLQGRQKEKAQSILGNTAGTLKSLVEKNASSLVVTNKVSMEMEAISGSIGEVVSSIQFHDITRQQVEHVKEALDLAAQRLGSRLGAVSTSTMSDGAEVSDEARETFLDARAVCALQKAQLDDSGKQFDGAAMSIIGNLKSIAGRVRAIYGQLEKLLGSEASASSSFFSVMEAEVSAAVSFFGEISDGIGRLSRAVAGLSTTVNDMSGFVDGVEEIGIDIELIAVNARIKAAHTGSEGAPLGVIAEAIQRLAADARVQKNYVSDDLRQIITMVEGLYSRASVSSGQQARETEDLLEELNALLNSLRSVNDSAQSLLSEIRNEGRRLSDDMEATADSIDVQREFDRIVAHSVGSLDAIVKESRALLPESNETDGVEMLRNLEKNYTMNSERHIHDAYSRAGGSLAGNELSLAQAARQNESHFDQNVELF